MLVLDHENTYGFANATVQVIDETYIEDAVVSTEVNIPDFNVLIPVVQETGLTNVVELYQPGDYESYVASHGNPNARKYGFGPNFIYEILRRRQSNVGVYSVNLRGSSATLANTIISMKWKVEEDVPYVDAEGNQYYRNPDAIDTADMLTTDVIPGAEVKRDVLHIKFVPSFKESCKKWPELYDAMNDIVSNVPDDDGYRTIPCFAVVYRGASAYGNGIYFSMTPTVSEFDGNMYYRLALFNGNRIVTTDQAFSFDMDAGAAYDQNFYIEHVFNAKFPTLRYITATTNQDMVELIQKYLYTVDDVLAGTQDKPSVKFSEIDPFSALRGEATSEVSKNNLFAVVVDDGSIDSRLTNAFQLQGGYDGEESRDELFRKFFTKEIVEDLADVIRYRMTYIPDIGYDDDTKRAIDDLCKERNYTTRATVMIGDENGFASAIRDHQYIWFGTHSHVRQLAKCQSAMMFDPWSRRTLKFPASYFDTIALMDHFVTTGNYFEPFAGAGARWKDYIEDTMCYPPSDVRYTDSLQKARINVVTKDSQAGAYLNDQMMDTAQISDQTELSNAFLVSTMLYDLIRLVHLNHFKFNESEEVRRFQEMLDLGINTKYAPYSASLSVTVRRVGTTGRAKSTNEIIARVDLKDINKWTNIKLYLVDE